MINLNSRQMDLLNKLIANQKVSIDEFSKEYFITKRTVYREIAKINKYIEDFNVKVTNTPKGLILEGTYENIINLKLTLPCFKSIMKAKNIKNAILIELLQTKEPIKIQYFASKFNVSNTTVSNYLNDIKKWFESKDINFISKPGVGIYVKTNEKNIRHAIIDLLYKNYNTDDLIGFMQKNYNESHNYGYSSVDELNIRLLNIIDYKTISIIEKVLIRVKITMNYQIEDRLYIELIVHLALAIKRLEKNQKIDIDEITLEKLKNSEEYNLSQNIANCIEEEIGIKMPDEEIAYIAVHLQGLRGGSESLNLNGDYLNSIVKKIIDEASKVFDVNLKKDLILKKDLSMHLLYSMYRLKCGYIIRNPLIFDIKKQYSDVFDKSKKILKVLQNELKKDISDDEIGYITMHFAASIERMKSKLIKFNALLVCSNGIGISRMLAVKLKRVHELNIIAVSSVFQLDEMIKSNNIDVVISTVPIKRNDVKVIVINSLFNENDIKKLESELNIKISINEEDDEDTFQCNMEKLKAISVYSSELNSIVKNTFFTEVSARRVSSIINELLNCVKENGLINSMQYKNIQSLLENRERQGTIILPKKNFAIYHCASEDINEATIVVGKLAKPINMINLMDKSEKVYTAFLMIAPFNKKESLEVIGDLSTSIIEQSDFIQRINESSNTENCRKIVEEALLKKLYYQIERVMS
ncbi:BglG family transcription antiterminator [Clostridium guangxiense]|uniref:BglG family transcription antiterminator n=2 Tax=Clostridium TaxID=1485 RepID=UPI001E650DD4|nr:PRD domain-containing protein [Clostridium guangxiense]MCD2347754.1 BglG family transcription antiterminator [Clostridium guangxiense]